MKTFKVEIDEVPTYSGTIQAETIEDAKDAIARADIVSLKNVEPIIGETKLQFIEEEK